jgi:hypothetical protein
LIFLNAPQCVPAELESMVGNAEELARLERRIAEVRDAIEKARHRPGWSGVAGDQEKILALLGTTLKALEARKAALQGATR